MQANVAKIRATRARLTGALTAMGFAVPPSQANFVLARWTGTPDARRIYEELKKRAIVVRYFDMRRLDDALRISIGSDGEIDALLAALGEIVS